MRISQDSGSVTHVIALNALTAPQTVCRVESDVVRSWRVTLGAPVFSDFGALLVPGGFIANAETLPLVTWQGTAPGPQGPSARIVWGTSKAQFGAQVDWASGCSFVVTGSYVQVINDPLNIGGTLGGRITFPAQIGPSESLSPPTAPPTLTKRFGTLGPGAIGSVGLPAYARRFWLIRESSPTPPEPAEISITNAFATEFYRFEQLGNGVLVQNGNMYAFPWQIPGAAGMQARLTYRNGPGAVGIVQPVAVFELDIG